MKTFFINNESDTLIVFFLGWAIDYKPFINFSFFSDILFVFDYSNLDFNVQIKEYKRKYLIAHSYGVFFSSICNNLFYDFKKTIAINGTLKPICKTYGINEKVFNITLKKMNNDNLKLFYKNMFSNQKHFDKFMISKPLIDIKNNIKTLENIKNIYDPNIDHKNIFTNVIISKNDKIFPFKSQITFWKKNVDEKKINIIYSDHFPFYLHNNLDWIVNI